MDIIISMSEKTMIFQKLYKNYAKQVYRYTYWLTGDEDEAKDITSETFVRIWTADTNPRAESVKAYLFTISRNLYLKDLRRKKRLSTINDELIDNKILPDKNLEIIYELKQVQKAMQQLPEIDRTVIIMHAEEEMSYKEIAQITGLSISAIKVKIFRARAKLNKLLNTGE
jgi:RNA polymerase sigma factor (sigma-70 family)